jgi:DNA ligase (NAD+)
VEGRLLTWIKAIDALEWGDKLVEQLVEAKLAREPLDLYKLTWEQIAALDRRGEKSAKKAIAVRDAKLPLTLPVFIAALGMDNFAVETAKLLIAAGYDTLDRMLSAKEEELAALKGLGKIKAAGIVKGLAARKDEIQRLLDAGIVPVTPKEEGPLSGLSFCFTGESTRPRAELTALVDSKGGRVLASVTKDLAYLVIADPSSTSSKAVKARKYGTKLITEAGLEALIAEREAASG